MESHRRRNSSRESKPTDARLSERNETTCFGFPGGLARVVELVLSEKGLEEYDVTMIELTKEQQQFLDGPRQPPVAVDPRTSPEYLLIRREISELVRNTLNPYGHGWDDPADDDLIRLGS